jgi:hypothetical protein
LSFVVMRAPRSDPFPFEPVRDLIGILRALYAADKARGAGARRLEMIAHVASELRRATDLAVDYAPGTLGHAAAWERAERAVTGLGGLVDVTTPLEPTLRAAGERVRTRPAARSEREAARQTRRTRS